MLVETGRQAYGIGELQTHNICSQYHWIGACGPGSRSHAKPRYRHAMGGFGIEATQQGCGYGVKINQLIGISYR
jgi:hypothetical protein